MTHLRHDTRLRISWLLWTVLVLLLSLILLTDTSEAAPVPSQAHIDSRSLSAVSDHINIHDFLTRGDSDSKDKDKEARGDKDDSKDQSENKNSKDKDKDQSVSESVKRYGQKDVLGLPLYQWLLIAVFGIALLAAAGWFYYQKKHEKLKEDEAAAAEEGRRQEREAIQRGAIPDPHAELEADQRAQNALYAQEMDPSQMGEDIDESQFQGDPRFLQVAQPRY